MTLVSGAGGPDGVGARAAGMAWPTAAARDSSWKSQLRAALDSSSVLVRETSLPVREAVNAARRGAPLVAWTSASGWIAILEGGDGRGRIAHASGRIEDLPAERIAVELAVGPEDAVDWLVIEAGLASAESAADHKLPPFRRLTEIVRPERQDILAIVLYSALVGLLTLAIPVAVQQLVNTVAFGGLVQPVVVIAFLLLVGLSISAALSAFQAYLAEVLQRRVFVRACVDLASRLPRVAAEAFGHRSPPAFVNRFFDLVTIQKTGARLLLEGSAVVLQTLTGLLILSFYHPLMLALSVLLLALMGAVTFVYGRNATQSAIRESSAKYDLAEWMEELVRHRSTFRTRGGRQHAVEQADSLIASWVGARRSHYRIVLRQFVAALGIQVLVNTLLLALGGFLVVAGELTLGQLVASEIIVSAVVAAFARLAKHFESYYDLMAAVDKVGGLLDLPLERADASLIGGIEPAMSALACEGLTVKLGGTAVIRDASMSLAPGTKAVLVGGAGSGKSTLFDVLAGIRSPDEGYVTLGGDDLRDLAPEVARDGIVVVRYPQILPGSVLDNLTIGRVDATATDAREALERVGLLDEIRALPDGLRTRLRSDGYPLSRSQAARLELARALVAEPAVLLLDEALLAIGEEEQGPVLDALFDPEAPWTLLAVSRDAEVVSRAQLVLELADGRIEQREAPQEVR